MKAKILQMIAGILSILILTNATAFSQQAKQVLPGNNDKSSYSYKLYNAPGNMFGYDIYENNKPIYHQFVLMFISKEGKRIVATKQQAEKAALLAIDKMKKGQAPVLSVEELKRLIDL